MHDVDKRSVILSLVSVGFSKAPFIDGNAKSAWKLFHDNFAVKTSYW